MVPIAWLRIKCFAIFEKCLLQNKKGKRSETA